MQPVPRGPLPDEALPSLVRFAERLTPELFRDWSGEDDEHSWRHKTASAQKAALEPLAAVATKADNLPERRRARGRAVRVIQLSAAVLLLGLAAPAGSILNHPASLAPKTAAMVFSGSLPPQSPLAEWPTAPVPPAPDSLHWWTLREAFDRIGFDLDSVASGSARVPRVMLVNLPPDLDGIDDLDARKDLFLRAFLPVVLTVNEGILEDRAHLLALRSKIGSGTTLSGGEVQWLLALADIYDQPDLDLEALLKKVDAIPPSLALAQAIEESGWGTSRIARVQNALFGQFGEDPLGDWDYRAFKSLSAAVQAYARNLNTHRAYREFRLARSRMRDHGVALDTAALATTLFRYSERGPLYVKNLRWIIRDNDLRAFDSAHLDDGSQTVVIASNDDARDFELPRP